MCREQCYIYQHSMILFKRNYLFCNHEVSNSLWIMHFISLSCGKTWLFQCCSSSWHFPSECKGNTTHFGRGVALDTNSCNRSKLGVYVGVHDCKWNWTNHVFWNRKSCLNCDITPDNVKWYWVSAYCKYVWVSFFPSVGGISEVWQVAPQVWYSRWPSG